MSRIWRHAFVMALLVVGSAVWQRSSEAADTAADRELCKRLWEDHLEAVMAHQPTRIAFTQDALVIYPDMLELRGRAEIQAHLAKVFAARKVLKAGFKIERVEVVGSRAYTFVLVDELVQEGAAAPARVLARYATVWEQQPDKSWQIAHLLVNYRKP
jgi:ketosteroid isomerase-like protein